MTIIEFNNIEDDYSESIANIEKCMASKAVVVLVWAVWCPHCTSMKNDWDLLKTNAKTNIHFIEIESQNLERIKENNKKLFKKFYPQADRVMFPMIKSYSDKKGTTYNKERSYDVMKTHFEKQFAKKKTANKAPSKTQKGGNLPEKTFRQEFDKYINKLLRQLK